MSDDRHDPEVRIAHLEGLLNAAALERHALLDRLGRYRAALARIADAESGHWGPNRPPGAARKRRAIMNPPDWCPVCRQRTSVTRYGVCPYCDTPLVRRRGGKPRGKYRLLSDDQVRAIHRVHIEAGLSIRELARQLHARFGYSGEKSMANCLSAAFDSLGLDARNRIDAVRLRCTVHGRATREHRDAAWTRAGRVRRGEVLDRPMCAAVRVQYPRKGQPCGNRALADSEFCWGHDPRYDELRRSILDDARRRLHGVPA